MSSPAQKRIIRDFKSVSGTTDKIATEILQANSWQLEQALDYYFTHRNKYTTTNTVKIDKTKIDAIYNKYSSTDILTDESLLQYFNDIHVDASSVVTLYLAYLFKCKNFGQFTRTEFVNGWIQYQCDTIDKMQQFITQSDTMKQLTSDKKQYKEFYRWLFDYLKEEPDRKTIDAETAYDMWQLVLQPHYPHIDTWVHFCRTQQKLRSVPKDVWEQLLEFSREIKPDYSNYDIDGGAWPLIMDEYVEYARKQSNKT